MEVVKPLKLMVEEFSPPILPLLLVLLLLLLLVHHLRQPRLPPGVPRLPLLGSVPWLIASGKKMMELVKGDRVKYGDLSSINLAFINIVFINEPKLIRDLLGRDQTAGRGRSKMGLKMKSWGKPLGIIDPDNTPVWKEQRRFILRNLKELGFGRKSEESVQEEAKALVDHLVSSRKEETLVKEQFNIPVVNVIWRMVASKTFPLKSEEGSKFIALMDELFTNTLSPLALFPIFGKLLVKNQIKRRFEMFREIRELFEAVIEEHEESLDESDPRDLVDRYLIEVGKGREDFSKEQLVIAIIDLFAAGSETSSTTLRWALLYLTINPQVQRRCQSEVDKLGSRSPGIDDMARLPYCQATINEVLRISCTAPGSLMHVAMEDIHVNGYTLPKGTGIAANFMATHMDPELWEAPEQFCPERFLNEDGTGLRETSHFFPFSVGKRVCLGESLARVELFIFFTALVKRCNFTESENGPPDPAKCHIGITRIPDAFHCKIMDRCSTDSEAHF